MSRYVLTFNKKGNMRFISHLDMQRLFRKVLFRAEVPVAFSQGFNPHPITNIVQPLSLGFEAETDYFEFETKTAQEAEEMMDKLNQALPEGISFTKIKEIPHEKKNLSSYSEFSEFKLFIPAKIEEDKLNEFLAQDEICVLKREKKTKEMVLKNIKNWIYSVSVPAEIQGGVLMSMILRAAPNETVNPLQLAESMLKFMRLEVALEDIRVSRIELYFTEKGNLKSLFDREVN